LATRPATSGEDEVGQIVVGAPQSSGQDAKQLHGDLGSVGDPSQ